MVLWLQVKILQQTRDQVETFVNKKPSSVSYINFVYERSTDLIAFVLNWSNEILNIDSVWQ